MLLVLLRRYHRLPQANLPRSFMPPKRAASTSKRKASLSDDEGEPSQSNKKTKVSLAPSENAQPTNKVLPVTIVFPQPKPGTLRLATWNVCGLAASQKKVGPGNRRSGRRLSLPSGLQILRGS